MRHLVRLLCSDYIVGQETDTPVERNVGAEQ